MSSVKRLHGLQRLANPKTCLQCLRQLSTTAPLKSGHNKWSTIKHDKGRNDAARSKQRAFLAKDIVDASRSRGPDLALNPRLADAVAKARKAGYPKAGIETAIARGQGRSMNGQPLESLMVEAVMPPVAMIVEALTDSKGKTLQELRSILKKAGAQTAPISYLFAQRGRIVFEPNDGVGVDEVLDKAIEVGALEVFEDDEGSLVLDTEPSALKEVEAVLVESYALEVSSSDTIWVPNEDTRVEAVGEEPLSQLARLQDELQDYPGVQGIYLNADVDALQLDAAAAAK